MKPRQNAKQTQVAVGGKLIPIGRCEMITPQVGAEGIRKALAILKETDETVVKDLRTELRSKLSPIAKSVIAATPATKPLRGMTDNRASKWHYSQPTALVSVTPGRSRKSGNSLVTIAVKQPKKKIMWDISEMVGGSWNVRTARGAALARGLNQKSQMVGRGGRFAYKKFRTLRPEAVEIAVGIVNRTVQKLSKKLSI